MEPVQIVNGRAVPLDRADVDTDQIIPSEYLKRTERTGFEDGLFAEWRMDPTFVLNRPEYSGAAILISGPNFGIGSSREHAVWALVDYGFKAVISARFGDIFRNNATRSGLVPTVVGSDIAQSLLDAVTVDPTLEITIDVEQRTVSAPAAGIETRFELNDDARERLLGGLDDIGVTMQFAEQIDRFEELRPTHLPTVEVGP